jgi:phage terminase large subunit
MCGLRAIEHYVINGQTNVITFYNKSEILLVDLFFYPSDPNFDDLGSLEITDWFCDEASQVSKKAIDIVRSRVRYKLNEFGLPPKGLMTCNPSKGWLYNEFYSPWKQGVLPDMYAFIQSKVTDNPHLPPSYQETLARLPDVDRKRLLEGDWEYDETLDVLFKVDDVLACFRENTPTGERYITADVARLGKDRTVIGVWTGLSLIYVHELRRARVNEVVDAILTLKSRYKIEARNVVIDEDGVGGGAVDAIKGCRGFVNGSRAVHAERYPNLKSECYYKLAELIEKRLIFFPITEKNVLVKELDMIRRRRPEQDGKLTVTSKEEIARIHGVSPDYSDMVMMRMLFEVRPNYGKYSYAV